jgi:hypothetical protein
MNICPTCGRPRIADDDGVHLTPIQARILDAVRRRPGIDAESLRSLAWPSADGGPESPSNLHVQVNQLNRKLAPYGIAVRGSRFYGYREVRL